MAKILTSESLWRILPIKLNVTICDIWDPYHSPRIPVLYMVLKLGENLQGSYLDSDSPWFLLGHLKRDCSLTRRQNYLSGNIDQEAFSVRVHHSEGS